MKRLLFTVLPIGFLLGSCSSDNGETEPSLIGTWNATSFVTSLSFDLNGDGEVSNDLIKELDCYASALAFREDGTFSSSTSNIILEETEEDTYTGECSFATSNSGTYTYENGILTTVNDGQTIASSVNLSETQLIIKGEDQDFGKLTITYSKN